MDDGLLHEGIGLIHGVPDHGVELPEKKNVGLKKINFENKM